MTRTDDSGNPINAARIDGESNHHHPVTRRDSVNREIKSVLAIVAAVAVIVLAALALVGGSTEISVSPSVELPPPGEVGPTGAPFAVVVSMHEDQETSFFGLRRGQTHYLALVQFYAAPGCLNLIADGDRWPASAGECSTGVPISGVIGGLGVAPTGETIVFVDAEIPEDCYNALEPGDAWPPDSPACL